MAKITCTIKDFHKYIGPRVRNVIQSMTKKRKKELNHICQICKQQKELEAAHIKNKPRKEIIESILKRYISSENKNLITIDLDKFEKEIIKSHIPLEKYFKFLCAKCHREYDTNKIDENEE